MAQPASLPPGVSGSGGIRRSTKASTVLPSCGVKQRQPSGVTAAGGSADPGFHGRPPLTIAARVVPEFSKSAIALEPRSRRRFIWYTGYVLAFRPLTACSTFEFL